MLKNKTNSKINSLLGKLSKGFLIVMVITAIISYIILSPPAMSLYGASMLFHPITAKDGYITELVEGIKEQNIYFKSYSGAKLHGWLFEKSQMQKKWS